MRRKLRIGWFSFTCCEDSTILFVELLNDKFFEWKDKIDFAYFRTIKRNNEISNLDVAFVEGAVSNCEEEKKLKEIRKNAKRLVAIGSCAVLGSPSNQRNFFDDERLKEIAFIIERFKLKEKVSSVSEVVYVDDTVSGCPMNEETFVTVLEKYMKEFGVV
ncbi:MAG: hypothetical protein J4428_00965 [Candidatus Aenigmarchaeota archaeon]|nr:hypothetical protein [Candidatus Aenigmarchaeota archaeon]